MFIETAVSFAKEVAKAQRVFIFGVGTSSVIAMDASYRFSQLGVQCYAYTDILQMNVMAISVYSDEENYPVEAVSARIAHMCVVDALMMTIASFEFDSYTEHIAARNKALDKIRY